MKQDDLNNLLLCQIYIPVEGLILFLLKKFAKGLLYNDC